MLPLCLLQLITLRVFPVKVDSINMSQKMVNEENKFMWSHFYSILH